MTQKPLIAVVGATGTQGGGLVRAILDDPARHFAVRAITRKPESPAAQALAQKGVEVVRGDADEAGGLDRAFAGAHGVYAVTNYWEHLAPERELTQALNMARAAERAGARHVIWASLVDTRRRVPLADPRMLTLMQRWKVPHYDAKGEADTLFDGVPTTFLRASFYWDNLIHFGMGPKRAADGVLDFVLPMGSRKLPGIAAADIGACALGVYARGEELVGHSIGIAGEHLSGAGMAAALARRLGEPVRHVAMSFTDYAQLGFPGAYDLANMFHYKHDFNDDYCDEQSVELSRELHPGLLNFERWLERHAHAISVLPATAQG